MIRGLRQTVPPALLAVLFVTAALSGPIASAQPKQNRDPDAAELVFSDIDLF